MLRNELAAQPTVLVVEDLHWGDEATFDVLRLLCRRMDVPSLVSAPIATTACIGITRCGCSSATSPRRRSSTGSRGTALGRRRRSAGGRIRGRPRRPVRADRREPVLRGPGARRRGAGCPRRCGTPSSDALPLFPSRRSRCSRRSRSPCRAPSHGSSRPFSMTAPATSTSASRVGSSRRTTRSSHSVTRSPAPRSRMRCRRHAGSGCSAAFSLRSPWTAPARSTRLGSRTTRRRPATRPRDSSSRLRPLTGRIRRAPTVRRPRSTRAPSGSAVRRSQPADAASCSKDARGLLPGGRPARGDRGRPRAIASRREEGSTAREALDLTELSAYLFCRGLLGEAGGLSMRRPIGGRPGSGQRGGVRRRTPVDERVGRRRPRGRRRDRPPGAGDLPLAAAMPGQRSLRSSGSPRSSCGWTPTLVST